MLEMLLLIGFFFWAIFRLSMWIFNAILGILPYGLAENIRRWCRFVVAIFIILLIISALAH